MPDLSSDFASAHTYRGIAWHEPLKPVENVAAALLRHARTRGSSPFLTETAGIGEEITFAAAANEVGGMAAVLRAEYGVGDGLRVAVAPRNDVTSVLAILAVMAAGGTAVLLNASDPVRRLREQSEAAQVSMLIAGETMAADVHPEVLEAPKLRALGRAAEPFTAWTASADQPAVIMFTTGSTAGSKPVVQTHYNVTLNSDELARHHAFGPGTRMLGVLPVYYANGLEFTVVATLRAGGRVLLGAGFDPTAYLSWIARHGVDRVSLVPEMLRVLCEVRTVPDISSLSYFATAAAPLRAETAAAVHHRFGKRIVQGYGLTETTNFSTIMPVGLGVADYRRLYLDAEIPPVGEEVFGNEVAVLDESMNPVPDGGIGQVCMRGHSVMAGYHGNPQADEEAFRGGWFNSGDLGRFTRDRATGRRLLTLTGRIKNMIKSGGRALSLDELDRVLARVPGVLDAVSVSLADPRFGEVPGIAYVASAAGPEPRELLARISQELPLTGLPVRLRRVEAVPRTGNGKVSRAQLTAAVFPAGSGGAS